MGGEREPWQSFLMVDAQADAQQSMVANVGLAAPVIGSLHYDHSEGQSWRSVPAAINQYATLVKRS